MNLLDWAQLLLLQLLRQRLASKQLLCNVLLLNRLDGLQVAGKDPRGWSLRSAQKEFSSGMVELDSANRHLLREVVD